MTKRYSIVGMNHRGTEQLVGAIAVGTSVILIREPDNKFDKNAIAVWVENGDYVHVGYLPKNQNAALAARIDQNGIGSFKLAQDAAPSDVRSIPAKFVRSPNSAYPMVEVSE